MNKIMISLNSPAQNRVKEFIKRENLNVEVLEDMLHPEKEHYYNHILGSESDDIGLIVTGYPSSINRIIKEDSDYSEIDIDRILPKELEAFNEPSKKIKVINLFHLGLVTKKGRGINISTFKGAVEGDDKFVIPPYTAPVPNLFKGLIEDKYGFNPLEDPLKVYPVLDPWDINRALMEERYDIGMNIPYFGYLDSSSIDFKWPKDGAVTVPSCMAIRKNASEDLKIVANYLLSREFQEYLAYEAHYYPTVGGLDYYRESDKSNFSMLWKGWNFFLK